MRTDETMFNTTGGLRLLERMWSPDDRDPIADIALVHGYAEHSGRYQRLAAFLTARGYAVSAVDLRGHGQSEGQRVLVRSFNEYLDDLDGLLARIREHSRGNRPVFLLGHSMGAAIAALAAVSRRPKIDGLLLSAAAIKTPSGPARLLTSIVRLVGRYFPRLGIKSLSASDVSRDPAVVANYDADTLNYRGKVPAGLAAAMIRAADTIDRRAPRIDMPLLVMHGAADALADPDGSQRLYDRATSIDKTIKIYQDLYHEILNEPEQELVMSDIAAWLDRHLPAAAPGAKRTPATRPSAVPEGSNARSPRE